MMTPRNSFNSPPTTENRDPRITRISCSSSPGEPAVFSPVTVHRNFGELGVLPYGGVTCLHECRRTNLATSMMPTKRRSTSKRLIDRHSGVLSTIAFVYASSRNKYND